LLVDDRGLKTCYFQTLGSWNGEIQEKGEKRKTSVAWGERERTP